MRRSDRSAGTPPDEPVGGRVFFSSVRRSLEVEDEILLISVGVDIGSSTSHLVFSRLLLERLDNRYVVSKREIVHESDVLLTPYAADQSIDAAALGCLSMRIQIGQSDPRAIDTGALILPRRGASQQRAPIADCLPPRPESLSPSAL